MENYFALAGVVNWVIEAAFLRAATKKKGSREFKNPRGLILFIAH